MLKHIKFHYLFPAMLMMLTIVGLQAYGNSQDKKSDTAIIHIKPTAINNFHCLIVGRAKMNNDETIDIEIIREFYRGVSSQDKSNRPLRRNIDDHKLELRTWTLNFGGAYSFPNELQRNRLMPDTLKMKLHPIANSSYPEFFLSMKLFFRYYHTSKSDLYSEAMLELFLRIDERLQIPKDDTLNKIVQTTPTPDEDIDNKKIVRRPQPTIVKSENALALEAKFSELDLFYNRIYYLRNQTAVQISQIEAEYQSFADFFTELPEEDETDPNYKTNRENYDLKLSFSLETIEELKVHDKQHHPTPDPDPIHVDPVKPRYNYNRIIIFILVGVLGLSLLGFLYVKLRKK
jgi:hypothetical protein